MNQDLTSSLVARQNVLNNQYALDKLEEHLQLGGLVHKGDIIFTKAQVANILDIDERTIERYLVKESGELKSNGYQIIKGKSLKELKLNYVDDMSVVDILDPKSPSLGVFNFRALLNIAMLVTESDRAKSIRSRLLDIVLDVVAEKTGGQTRFINQRDADYLPTSYMEESYRQQFTNALRDYLDLGPFKYGLYTDKVYQAIFLENSADYKKVLSLADKDKTRETMYVEVLKVISSFEHGLAEEMKKQFEEHGRKLKAAELDRLIIQAQESPYLKPCIEDARIRMASRDLGFRAALHHKLEEYVQAVPQGDFDKFLGDKSRSLEEQLSDTRTLEVLKRLKDR